ncbi:hypothetical protein GZH46_02819 [Fragariocoptes setiger]|uniref:Uncharacterized protein n=1 Tax=Fragariocoptes setiger TaxID=1670756 RepID=A0ABQ7S5I0_9ACAR|nr:hypothetical protein GZH46_02819 [Fragariocoptes setiger]
MKQQIIVSVTVAIVHFALAVSAGPVVETIDKPDGGRYVGVHIPAIYNMNLDKSNVTGVSKLDLTVLGGLVHVFRNRTKDQEGRFTGPITVSIFGLPVYDNGQRPALPVSPLASATDGTNVERSRTNDTIQSPPTLKGNDLLGALDDFINRITANLRNQLPVQSLSPITVEQTTVVPQQSVSKVPNTTTDIASNEIPKSLASQVTKPTT